MRVLIAAIAFLGLSAQAPGYRVGLDKYRHDRLEELTAPNGWLAVRGLFWLHEGANTAGSDPSSEIRLPSRAPKRIGVFTLAGGAVTFTADPAAAVTSAGKPVSSLTLDPRGGERSAIVAAGVSLFVIRRAEKVGLRMLDPESPQRTGFAGLKYFPLNAAYRVRAAFTPYDTPKQVPVPNVLGQLVPMESPGYVVFTIKGQSYRLEPVYETSRREDLFFIFKDLTSKTETYEAGRFLHAPLPQQGIVDLDFNRAYNPPCAFTEFATCPLPIKANQLDVRIPAGERRFHLPAAPSAYQEEIERYRADRLANLMHDYGLLTFTSHYFLEPGDNTAGSAKGSDFRLPAKAPANLGVFTLEDGKVFFAADPSAVVTSEGQRITGREMSVTGRDRLAIVFGDLSIFASPRGKEIALRMRDLKSERRANFRLKHYPLNDTARVTAAFTPYDTPKPIPIVNGIGELENFESPGFVTFRLNGQTVRLDPVFEDKRHEDLWFMFTDLTSRDATYPAGRYVHAALPKDGQVIIDFNKAYSPPCAFNDFATCPLPPKQNRLPIRIEAGELRPPNE